ncbi:hypothetical protein [Faecalibaculum rodentium]|jgi:hypothetical protein|uniref:Uncharacterized protein n=1 Tax=Faecalibaculum rodentium TaxID=1702221 RepID=A0A1Q9YHJ8_9FIRM|nr:hypothetical protein [Faecalibaculum rodentium]OLU43600.1 hypothetical protein BO223_11555 [Faecalibaculum rodentium]
MSKRLMIDVMDSGSVICSIYYHCSANTHRAYVELKQLVDIIENSAEVDPVLAIIAGLSKYGGGLVAQDKDYAKWRWPNREVLIAENRNAGLVTMTADSMSKYHQLADGFAEICLDNHTCTNLIWNGYCTWREMKACYEFHGCDWDEKWTEEYFANLPVVRWLGESVPWVHLNEAIAEVENSKEYRTESGSILFDLGCELELA